MSDTLGNQLVVWWGPVEPPLDPLAPDLRIVADPQRVDIQAPRVFDVDVDGLGDLVVQFQDQDLDQSGFAVIWGDRL